MQQHQGDTNTTIDQLFESEYLYPQRERERKRERERDRERDRERESCKHTGKVCTLAILAGSLIIISPCISNFSLFTNNYITTCTQERKRQT